MSDWAEDLRRDRAAETRARAEAKAELLRARAEAEAIALRAEAEQRRADERAEAERRREEERARRSAQAQAERAKQDKVERRRARRAAARAKARSWLRAHVIEVLIYPFAAVSFAMAAPAMAAYGQRIYADTVGGALGALLPVITELGMWAFAVAVHVAHARRRPIWALRLGLVLFASAAFAMNALHGWETGAGAAAVMGMVSVAGIVAHQLAVATPLPSRDERARARLERQARRRLTTARRAAISQASVELDTAGHARLVIQPGHYTLRRGRLSPAKPDEAGNEPPNQGDDPRSDDLDRELAALLDSVATVDIERPTHDGGIATLEGALSDPDRSQTVPETAAETAPGTGAGERSDTNRPAQTPVSSPGEDGRRRRSRRRSGGRRNRPYEVLKEEFAALLATNPEAASWSASRIARTLRCAKDRALVLRDEMQRRSA